MQGTFHTIRIVLKFASNTHDNKASWADLRNKPSAICMDFSLTNIYQPSPGTHATDRHRGGLPLAGHSLLRVVVDATALYRELRILQAQEAHVAVFAPFGAPRVAWEGGWF